MNAAVGQQGASDSNERDEDSLGQKVGIERTMLFWQPRASKKLTAEDARQMIENVTGFFAQLEAWDTRELSAVIGILEGQEENVAA